jgi:hypothetical protein
LADLRFYLDENVPLAIASQLNARGIDVVSVRELGTLGQSDRVHLSTATELGRVLCSHDIDFVRLTQMGISHSGLVIAVGSRFGVGDWVRGLAQLHARYTAEDFINRVEYL